ncbi:virginiamycin B lyase family protein [Marinicella meishanensis]|uniref:virginiamycin B lyase family protein n=1 Tax=Marinicella meishanensis TaxID=2873263 RepID=UPI001CBE0455|nr:hypothetical protein [Marinicella sp. NBU2979]
MKLILNTVAMIGLCAFASFSLKARQVSTLTPTIQASGDIAVAPNGDIFVADYGVRLNQANGANVLRVTPTGDVSVFATGFASATGNTFGPDGALYQSNGGVLGVDRIDANGNRTPYARNGGIAVPIGLAFDSNGDLFVNNCGNNSISKVTPNGAVSVFSASSLFACPNGLTIDDADNLYAVNFSNGIITKITPDGSATFFARTPGSSSKPAGGNGHITFGNGQLYLVSNATHQVFSLSLQGELTVIAGSGEQGNADGEALEASFSLPNGIDLSPDGALLYVNDSLTIGTNDEISPNVIRVIELPEPVEVEPGIEPNDGMTGAWHNLDIASQGLMVDIKTDINSFFAAWFTYDDQIPGELRWLTLQGGIDDDMINAEIFNTTGGQFNEISVTDTQAIGTAMLKFTTCSSAEFSYEIIGGPSGSFELERSVPDVFCQTLIGE